MTFKSDSVRKFPHFFYRDVPRTLHALLYLAQPFGQLLPPLVSYPCATLWRILRRHPPKSQHLYGEEPRYQKGSDWGWGYYRYTSKVWYLHDLHRLSTTGGVVDPVGSLEASKELGREFGSRRPGIFSHMIKYDYSARKQNLTRTSWRKRGYRTASRRKPKASTA